MTGRSIVIVGAGRMGRGIAQCYALAQRTVVLVDLKQRDTDQFDQLVASVRSDIKSDLKFMQEKGYMPAAEVDASLDRIRVVESGWEPDGSQSLELVFEALPETLEHKQQAFDWTNQWIPEHIVVASTTSTLNVDELATLVNNPGRFLNAHWLNPAHLMPLVEVAVGEQTTEDTWLKVRDSLEAIGKVPVRCKASPGYIVPRIQALAMNEAARMVEEGVASAEDIDTAVRVGFGIRFGVLGLVEFIDWGGNDTLFHASRHMSRTIDENRFAAPDIVTQNMNAGLNGLREGQGFYDYRNQDVDAYRRQRLGKFLEMVEYADLLPAGLSSPISSSKSDD